MQEICWSTADARRLKKLRLEAGYDLVQFSKLSSVSVAQINQLEESGDSLFFSQRIKYSVGKRLTLLLLKGQDSHEKLKSLSDEKIRNKHVTSNFEINAIAEMSRRNLDASPIKDFFKLLSYQLQHLILSKYVLSSIGMIALMLAVWTYEHQIDEGLLPSKLSLQSSSTSEGLALLSNKWDFFWGGQFSSSTPKMTADRLNTTTEGTVTPSQVQPGVSESGGQMAADLSKTETISPLRAPFIARLETSASVAPSEKASINTSGAHIKGTAHDFDECVFKLEGPEITPTMAYKPSSYVYLEALADTVICLEDGQKKMSRLSLLAGSSKTVTGSSPWKLSIQAAQEVKVFYQGQRMQLPGSSHLTFTLNEYRP